VATSDEIFGQRVQTHGRFRKRLPKVMGIPAIKKAIPALRQKLEVGQDGHGRRCFKAEVKQGSAAKQALLDRMVNLEAAMRQR